MSEMNTTPSNADLRAQIDRQNTSTPKEANIRKQILDIPKTPAAKETVKRLGQSEDRFLHEVLSHPGIDQRLAYDKQLTQLANIMGETIVSGSENIDQLRGKPVIIVANHFGANKYTFIQNQESNGRRPLDIPLDEVPTFAVRGAMFLRVTQALGSPMRDTGIEFPGKLGQAQHDCGLIIIPAAGEGRTQRLAEDVKQTVATDGNPAIVIYPEGGTSGKESNKGPYDLENFSTGAFVVAAQTGLPILPTCTIFNGETGKFELYVLPPVSITPQDLTEEGKIAQITSETRAKMQEVLDAHAK